MGLTAHGVRQEKLKMTELRIKALELAHSAGDKPDAVVKRADAYLAFLNCSTASAGVGVVAPTPTASPLAEAEGTEPARLDDPKVIAATKEVIEHPTVSGDTPQDAPSTASGKAETPPAEPEKSTAPSAGTGSLPQPALADVNAAVLAYNRANGREKTVALLAKFGGAKVPEIAVEKHAELLAELKAGF